MNINREFVARVILVLSLAGAVATILFGWWRREGGVLVRARMPENGGWSPEHMVVEAGVPIRLRLTSDDVTHGFAVGQMGFLAVDVHPGQITEVALTFDRPGLYTYYCTRWCGPNHWRMRGTIEVTGDASQAVADLENRPPLYQELGIDIDASHPASATPQARPAAANGESLLLGVPESYLAESYYRSHSPVETWLDLKNEPLGRELSYAQLWSLVAAIWQLNTDPQDLKEGRDLYAQNCAACHGEDGGGDGVMADNLAQNQLQLGGAPLAGTPMGGMPVSAGDGPKDFTDPRSMLGASPALLQGKIIRGGMGTGMPYWGPIFTEEQTWALVAYLWTFQFDY
jgi:mono/diheme cytochrome c family protein/plastocyanin